MFLTGFFGAHLRVVELAAAGASSLLGEQIQAGHIYLVLISRVKEREIFKICLEYWLKMVREEEGGRERGG